MSRAEAAAVTVQKVVEPSFQPPPTWVIVTFLAVSPFMVVVVLRFLLARCPRCGKSFFADHFGPPTTVFRRQCVHCDLPL